MPKIPFNHIFPQANPQGSSRIVRIGFDFVALDLLERLLAFDPAERITVEDALEHPYLAIWHDPNDEPECATPFDFSFEHINDIAQMKRTFPPSRTLAPCLRHFNVNLVRDDLR